MEGEMFVLELALPNPRCTPDGLPLNKLLPPTEAKEVVADLGDGHHFMLDHYFADSPGSDYPRSLTFLPSVGHLDNRS